MPRGKRKIVLSFEDYVERFDRRYRMETSEYREASKAPLAHPRVKNVITVIVVVHVIIL